MTVRLLSPGICRVLCLVLSAVMGLGPCACAWAQTPRPAATAGSQTAAAAGPVIARIDTTYLPHDAEAAIVIRPAQILTSPNTAMLPVEVATAAGIKYLGFDPANIEEVVAFAKQPANLQPPEYGVALKFIQPFRGSDISPDIRAHTQPGELAGRKYLQSASPFLPSYFAPDARTLVVAPDATLRRMVEAKGPMPPGPLMQRVRAVRGYNDFYAAVDLASLRPLIQGGLAMAQLQVQDELPPDAAKFFQAPELISAAELTVNMSNPGVSSFVVHANDPASALQLDQMIVEATKMYQDAMNAGLSAQFANSADPVEKAFAAYLERTSGQWANMFRPERRAASLTFFRVENNSPQQQMVVTAVGGILVALLLPAVQAAREAARRNQSMNNMKQLALGLLNHESAKGSFPAHAVYSEAGQPLLSWRVQILPFLDEEALYREFHLDEPWDSEHNRQLISRMPEVFANPNLPFPPTAGKTNYVAVVGGPNVMNGTSEGVRMSQISDGTSNTILIVEANADEAVDWTKPDDLEREPNFLGGLGAMRPGGFLAAFCDGHVALVSDEFDLNSLPGKFTIAGGEPAMGGMMQPGPGILTPAERQPIDPSQFFGPGRGDAPMDDGGRGGPVEFDRGRGAPPDDEPRGRGRGRGGRRAMDAGATDRGRGDSPDDVPRGRDGEPIR